MTQPRESDTLSLTLPVASKTRRRFRRPPGSTFFLVMALWTCANAVFELVGGLWYCAIGFLVVAGIYWRAFHRGDRQLSIRELWLVQGSLMAVIALAIATAVSL